MADRDVAILTSNADLQKAQTLASAFPGGTGSFIRAIYTEAGKRNLVDTPAFWVSSGPQDEDMVAAFEASARLAQIQGQLQLEEDPTLIAPYEVIPLDGTTFPQLMQDHDPVLYFGVDPD